MRKAEAGIPIFGELADVVLVNKTAETTSKAKISRVRRALEVYAEPLRPVRIDAVDSAQLDVGRALIAESFRR